MRPDENSPRNEQTLQLCNYRRENQRILPIPEMILRPGRHTYKIGRALGHETPVWLDDIIIVTRGTKEEQTKKLETVITKLENERYKASKKILSERNHMAGTHHHTRRD